VRASSTSEPSGSIWKLEVVADAVLTANRKRPSWLISTRHGGLAVGGLQPHGGQGTRAVDIERRSPPRPSGRSAPSSVQDGAVPAAGVGAAHNSCEGVGPGIRRRDQPALARPVKLSISEVLSGVRGDARAAGGGICAPRRRLRDARRLLGVVPWCNRAAWESSWRCVTSRRPIGLLVGAVQPRMTPEPVPLGGPVDQRKGL
jgi:hypothetical protein